MGCNSVQFGSMERYLVVLTQEAAKRDHRAVIVYEHPPKVIAFHESIKRAGGKLIALRMRNFFDIHYFYKLHRLIKENQINVIHAYFTPTCHFIMLYAWLIGFKKRFRTSANMPLTTHSLHRKITKWFKLLFALKQRFYAIFPKKILVLSEAMKKEFLDLGINPQKLKVVYGGVDNMYFSLENKAKSNIKMQYDIKNDEKIIIFTGRFVPTKCIDYLIKSMPLITQFFPNVKLFLVGDGPLRNSLEKLTKNLNVVDNVVFTGHKSEIRDILSIADVLVLPSVSEGISNSLLEAMAYKKPVIASNISPNRELVIHGKNGFLVQLNSTRSIAEAAIKLLKNESLAKSMGEYGYRLVIKKFNVFRRVREELDLYELMS